MSDFGLLCECFEDSLDSSQKIRKNAEFNLKQAENLLPDFPYQCLHIIATDSLNLQLRLTAVIYLKNVCSKNWKSFRHDDKIQLRLLLLNIITTLNSKDVIVLQNNLISILKKIIELDYETNSNSNENENENWKDLVDLALNLLINGYNSSDCESIHLALIIILEIIKIINLLNHNQKIKDLDKILHIAFDYILNIANVLVADDSEDAAKLLKLILKIYKFTIYVSTFFSSAHYLIIILTFNQN